MGIFMDKSGFGWGFSMKWYLSMDKVVIRCGFSTGRPVYVEKCGQTKSDTSKRDV